MKNQPVLVVEGGMFSLQGRGEGEVGAKSAFPHPFNPTAQAFFCPLRPLILTYVSLPYRDNLEGLQESYEGDLVI